MRYQGQGSVPPARRSAGGRRRGRDFEGGVEDSENRQCCVWRQSFCISRIKVVGSSPVAGEEIRRGVEI